MSYAGFRRMSFLGAILLLIGTASGCATAPKEIYRGYSGSDLPDESLATVELGTVDWVRLDPVNTRRGQRIAHPARRARVSGSGCGDRERQAGGCRSRSPGDRLSRDVVSRG